MSFDFVGVNLSKNSIKVVKLEESRFGKIPIKFKEYELSQSCGLMLPEPEFKDCEEIIGILKKVKIDFGVNYVNVSIPEVRNYIYKTKLPSNVDNKIYETLLFSTEENVPIRPEEVLIDYFVIGANDQEVEVVVTAIPKTIVDLYTRLFEEAGLKPISFEPETHAISRAIIKKGDKSKYLLLNLDLTSLSIAVIEKEVVQYTQILPFMKKRDEKEFDVEELKTLKEEIQKVIIYWETSISNYDQEKINTLFVVGETVGSNKLLNYLDKNLPVNVKRANVWNNCFDLNSYIPQIKSDESLKYAVAVGLGLKKIK